VLEFYNQQVYLGNYDLCELIREAAERSNQRIAGKLIPLVKRPSAVLDLSGLPIQQRTEQLSPIKKKSLSETSLRQTSKDPFRMTPNFLEIITARKLKTRDSKHKLTEDASPTKSKKRRPKKIFDKLYNILEAKNIFTDTLYQEAESL
jgi:hypothetical protein